MAKIKRALISVSEKTGIVDLARELAAYDVEIISTGGTAKLLRENGLSVKDVSDITGFPEMLDGRVKTLHPKIHGGILAVRSNKSHLEQLEKHQIAEIDMVVVNLYPFENTISKPDCTFEEAIENIDIGGPTSIRAASKNYTFVTTIVDPDDYSAIIKEMKDNNGNVTVETNKKLAKKVFIHTARYDSLIAQYLEKQEKDEEFPSILSLQFEKVHDLRYGENPHQAGAFYKEPIPPAGSVSFAKQLQGKEMSFNNYLDADAALELTKEFDELTCVVVKHLNPCGVSGGDATLNAYRRARETDPVSAFGGVIAFNRQVDIDTAREITDTFVEIVIAPGFTPEALTEFTKKKNLRVLDTGPLPQTLPQDLDFKRVVGGLVIHQRDRGTIEDIRSLKVVSKKQPTDAQYRALAFNWKVCKYVKSNAIVYGGDGFTIGIGAGQMNRVDSAKIARMKAQKPTQGAVMASDAFFPFRDGIDAAADAGITAIIQPGGSQRDNEVIQAADERDIAMIVTGMRHFRH